MQEIHEINLQTLRDKIIEEIKFGDAKRFINKYELLNPEHYYYIIKVYRFRYENFCEICHNSFEKLYEINPKNEISYSGRLSDRYICNDCAKPILIQLRWDGCKEKCENHPKDCTCHYCQIGIELGYKKKNGEWIKV